MEIAVKHALLKLITHLKKNNASFAQIIALLAKIQSFAINAKINFTYSGIQILLFVHRTVLVAIILSLGNACLVLPLAFSVFHQSNAYLVLMVMDFCIREVVLVHALKVTIMISKMFVAFVIQNVSPALDNRVYAILA